MSLVIPTDTTGSSFYTQKVTLDSKVYTLTLRWNNRASQWMLDILDAVGNELVLGCPLLNGELLLSQFSYLGAALPPWGLFIVDLTGQDRDPDLNSLGGDVLLMYGGS